MELREYLAELNKVDLLERTVEKSLWQAYKDGQDMDARRSLIEAYQPLVFKQAMRFRLFDNIMDIIQEGTVGLIEAVENYDPEKGVAFSLYAVHRIRGRMVDFLEKEGRSAAALNANAAAEGAVSALEKLMDPGIPVAEQAEQSFLSGQLQNALQRLPEQERAVLQEVYLQSREPREVAEILEVSISHIYRLQKNGIRRVRGMLSKLMQHW